METSPFGGAGRICVDKCAHIFDAIQDISAIQNCRETQGDTGIYLVGGAPPEEALIEFSGPECPQLETKSLAPLVSNLCPQLWGHSEPENVESVTARVARPRQVAKPGHGPDSHGQARTPRTARMYGFWWTHFLIRFNLLQ